MFFYNIKKYLVAFIIGFVICWFLFTTNLSSLYKCFIDKIEYKGLTYLSLFLLYYVVCIIFYDLFENFIDKKQIKRKFFIAKWTIITSLCISTYFICENKMIDWKYFLINMLNLFLYMFAWYSLLKAFKVWKNYGKFYKLFIEGKILKISFYLFFTCALINFVYFKINNYYFENSLGLFTMSLLVLFFICFVLSLIFYYCKSLKNKLQEFYKITQNRVKNNDTPKEVSIVYDQLTLITILSVISKRVFDMSKEVDFPFIFSKIFKIFCYSTSLITTCVYARQLKKVICTLIFVALILSCLIICSHSRIIRTIIVNDDINRMINLIIDYIFLPFGTIKVIIQILTIIIAKRATSISTDYFKIAAFFSIMTSFNLIAKQHFLDNTITMSFFKCLLYFVVIIIANLFNKTERQKNSKR